MTREELNQRYPWMRDTELFQHANGGGWVQQPERVDASAYIGPDAQVYGDALVYGNARVYGDALVSGNALVYGNAQVSGNARVYGDALVSGNAQVYGDAQVSGNARVYGNAQVSGNARLLTFGPIGSRNGYTSYALDSDTVMCGCFTGTLDQFAEAVRNTHGKNEHGRRYAALIEILRKW